MQGGKRVPGCAPPSQSSPNPRHVAILARDPAYNANRTAVCMCRLRWRSGALATTPDRTALQSSPVTNSNPSALEHRQPHTQAAALAGAHCMQQAAIALAGRMAAPWREPLQRALKQNAGSRDSRYLQVNAQLAWHDYWASSRPPAVARGGSLESKTSASPRSPACPPAAGDGAPRRPPRQPHRRLPRLPGRHRSAHLCHRLEVGAELQRGQGLHAGRGGRARCQAPPRCPVPCRASQPTS